DTIKEKNCLTHNGWCFENIVYKKNLDINEYDNYDVICIDEGQFFDDIHDFCKDSISKGKDIYISALNGDFKQEPFENISKIIPLCSDIIKKNSKCTLCGDDAHFTKRMIDQSDKILIGDSNQYQARCYSCFDK